ncbi:glycosyltransferase family 2 protein [Phascolarctobacterium sp.]
MKQNGYKKSFGLISIIMATYNAENTIGQAITSVIQQTYTDFELIIINDCSTDRTVDVINEFVKKDARIRLINNSKNMGVSYTRKHGLDEAKGSWIAILDSDDLWLPEKLAKQVEFQKKTNADLLYTGSGFMNVDGKQINWKLNVPEVITYRQLLKQNILSNSSALVRKDLYEKYYAVGDDMHEDFAIWLQILRNGIKAYGINEPLLIYRLDDKSKSGNKFKAAMMNWNTYRYIGLNLLEAAYYEFWYAINGLCKYKHFR